MLNKVFLSQFTKTGKIWVLFCVISSYHSSLSLSHFLVLSLTFSYDLCQYLFIFSFITSFPSFSTFQNFFHWGFTPSNPQVLTSLSFLNELWCSYVWKYLDTVDNVFFLVSLFIETFSGFSYELNMDIKCKLSMQTEGAHIQIKRKGLGIRTL